MKIVQYGDWKISVDTVKTKQYYDNYTINGNQANRNFAEYCKTMSEEERTFFNNFGITPECCEIEHIGTNKKGAFPCGGYYLVCGTYLEHPSEKIMSIEKFVENDFEDNCDDSRINIGIFQFDFQCEGYVFNDFPKNMLEGFICIRFWCENMKWLLSEKPEVIMYEPPHFWEIRRIIKERCQSKKQQALHLEQTKQEITNLLKENDIVYYALSSKEINGYKCQWISEFAPKEANVKEIKKLCLNKRKFTPFLWHIFSFGFLSAETGQRATELFNQVKKNECILISNVDEIGYILKNACNLTADLLENFVDVTVFAADFFWTYAKTHESDLGPYFYQK